MLRYHRLARHPGPFRALTGLSIPEFDALAAEAMPALAAADAARLSRPDRRRAIGAGHPRAFAPRDQVLLTVIWLRRYPTDGVLGYLAGVDEATIRRVRKRVVPVLAELGRDTMRLPDPGRGHRRPLEALLADTPELAVLIDTFEQAIQRPGDLREADALYSGKKKRHTLKTQIAVDERDGRIVDLSASVRGPTADLALLKQSGLLARVPAGVGAIGDLAYVGIGALHPGGAAPRRKPRRQPRPAADIAYNQAFARRRVRVEHTIRRLRLFDALTAPDRHHRRDHALRGQAVAGLVNRRLAQRAQTARPHVR